MAKPFFTEDWEKWTPEELSRARSRLAGFIEATPDKEKLPAQTVSERSVNSNNIASKNAYLKSTNMSRQTVTEKPRLFYVISQTIIKKS